MHLPRPIISPRLLLRCLEQDDASANYLAWLRDPDVTRYLEVRFAEHSIESLRRYIVTVNDSDDTLLLGIFLREGEQHIGNVKLGPIHPIHRRADMGLLIGEKAEWGKGYASEAIVAVADYAFAQLGLAKLTAGCYGNNEGSWRAFLKAGFVEEGRQRAQWDYLGTRQDGILLGLTRPT